VLVIRGSSPCSRTLPFSNTNHYYPSLNALKGRYSNRLKRSQLKDPNAFHLNQFEDSQQGDDNDPPRSLFWEETMEGHAPIFPFEQCQYLLNFILNADVF
jgi:hypothetical protein